MTETEFRCPKCGANNFRTDLQSRVGRCRGHYQCGRVGVVKTFWYTGCDFSWDRKDDHMYFVEDGVFTIPKWFQPGQRVKLFMHLTPKTTIEEVKNGFCSLRYDDGKVGNLCWQPRDLSPIFEEKE